VFFKAPYHSDGERPQHDLFRQQAMLEAWLTQIARRSNGAPLQVSAAEHVANG